MRITRYTTELTDDKITAVVKENSSNYEINNLNCPENIVRMMKDVFHADRKAEEYVWLIATNTKMKPIGLFELTHGYVNASQLGSREVFVRLCLLGASSFVVVHNHPSGDPSPSADDNATTKRLKSAADIMGIPLVDHIIIGDSAFYSYAEHNFS